MLDIYLRIRMTTYLRWTTDDDGDGVALRPERDELLETDAAEARAEVVSDHRASWRARDSLDKLPVRGDEVDHSVIDVAALLDDARGARFLDRDVDSYRDLDAAVHDLLLLSLDRDAEPREGVGGRDELAAKGRVAVEVEQSEQALALQDLSIDVPAKKHLEARRIAIRKLREGGDSVVDEDLDA